MHKVEIWVKGSEAMGHICATVMQFFAKNYGMASIQWEKCLIINPRRAYAARVTVLGL